ncbi:MAG TPA: S8 family serine peptidase, partial [Burkholderiaceae bacterium]|nr:S8 family serine peptidase [Burkholderiaceae bacterium]
MPSVPRRALIASAVAVLASCGGQDTSPEAAPPASTSVPIKATVLSTGTSASSSTARKVYLIQLAEPAATAYAGGIAGYKATRAERGAKFDASQPSVESYRAFLLSRQAEAMQSAGVAKSLYQYAYTYNGFAAELTPAQAAKLAARAGVLAVTEDELLHLDTASTPSFLGLSGNDGLWRKTGARGENVVIGMVDSGIWPELESFSDKRRLTDTDLPREHGGPNLAYAPPKDWRGKCVTGEQFTADMCNNKLIGARYYTASWGGDAAMKAAIAYEFASPRDDSGHGTHTASTAGGNALVTVTGPAAAFGKISGIAPRARIAVYKVCYGRPDHPQAGCKTADSVAAIDQAVADGVDVINFSISGSTTSFVNPVEQAFMRAADAGVFVAASAGNSGPKASTVAHPSPWITTVAAGTHNRSLEGTVTLGNGTTLAGASAAVAALPATALINAADAGLPGANARAVQLCFTAADNAGAAVLDPAKVAGKIVVCDRGTNARTNKSQAVADAGGVGMVLVNPSVNTLNADFHAVPTVHLQAADGAAVKAYAATAGATGAISQAGLNLNNPAPKTADFSSRGPSLAASSDILKPDIIAPGQDILAGVAPPGNQGRQFDLYSGTSMSSPHIAGIAALMKELRPRWSPMAIKSALMTTAGDVLDGPNSSPDVIFAQGAGHVQPLKAAEPGLVFDSDLRDWLGFLCSTDLPASTCTAADIPVIDPVDMNTASVAFGTLAGQRTVTRRVTNVDSFQATYSLSKSGLDGIDVTMTPARLTLAPGQTRVIKLTFTRTTAKVGTYGGGQLMLTGAPWWGAGRSHRVVRVPVVIRPVALTAPLEVTGPYSVVFGFSGAFGTSVRGLVPAVAQAGHVAATGSVVTMTVNVPAGTTLARFALFDANVSTPSDLDIEVFDAAGKSVGTSGGPTAAESVNLTNPAAGVYTVKVTA